MSRLLIGLLAIVALASSTYTDDVRSWQQQRDKSLRSEDGWLALVGLFWLKPGDNTIGSDAGNDFPLPKGSAPAHAGTIRLEGDQVTFVGADGTSRVLKYHEGKPDVVKIGFVSFFIIKRGDKLAVRAKDSNSPVLKRFTGMKYFPINPAFRFEAKFIPDEKKIPILNILGQTDIETSPGIVEFTFQGKPYRLRPIYEGKTLFFLFKDPTNHVNTYQAGRMLNTPLPENGKVDLDFNRSYNPPCTFTPYATCPLPPRENTLPFAVEAGEMRYGKGHAEYDTP
ncbi:MAG TPA: DUF1684 domain-containing protein [Bryobacteraceae bacterium]|nr:DUF1684 domain-containing protein [Bryobacteraceae bacterium]